MESSLGSKPARNSYARCEMCNVKGMQCVLYKCFCLHCSRCADVFYKVFNVYYTGCAMRILHRHLEEEDDLISNLSYKTIFFIFFIFIYRNP